MPVGTARLKFTVLTATAIADELLVAACDAEAPGAVDGTSKNLLTQKSPAEAGP